MGTITNISKVKFSDGKLVHHRLFDYRGVIVDVNRNFQGTEEWYETVAKYRPPKNRPWYHVLAHGSEHYTYVAEQNLETDGSVEPAIHRSSLQNVESGLVSYPYPDTGVVKSAARIYR